MFNHPVSKAGAVLCACLVLAACNLKDKRPQVVTGTTMGTGYMLSLGCELPPDLARQLVETAFQKVDESMSTYRSDSELMRLNRAPLGEWRPASRVFIDVVNQALEFAALSDGAFDPTIGALVRLWGFADTDAPEVLPSDRHINQLLAETGYLRLEVDATRLALRRQADFSLDLSAIAKGYAVDLAMRALEDNNCHDLLLELGGEVGVRGVRPRDGRAWTVGVESPDTSGGVSRAVELINEAIATSGDYRNQRVIAGQVFSHTLDPATWRPVTHSLASVSVIADSVMRADALATALNVMGPERAEAFARLHNIDALFIIRTQGGFETRGSGRFRRD